MVAQHVPQFRDSPPESHASSSHPSQLAHVQGNQMDARFRHPYYLIRSPTFALFTRTFRVLSPSGEQLFFIKHAIPHSRLEWHVFGDEAQIESLLRIKKVQIVGRDFLYELTCPQTQALIGRIRFKRMRGALRDKVEIINARHEVIGHLIEKGSDMFRRALSWLTGRHDIEVNGVVVGTMRQRFRFWGKEFCLDQTQALSSNNIDSRLLMTCSLISLMRESRRGFRKQ